MTASGSGGGLTGELASFISTAPELELPPGAVKMATSLVRESIGCALLATGAPLSRILTDFALASAPARGGSVLWGTSARSTPELAALRNGAAVHGFEYDDVHEESGIHPGGVTVPVALALADAQSVSGRDLVRAVAIGSEVGVRIGSAIQPGHFLSGWHPQGTVGAFAAVATASVLLRVDAATIANALGIVASHASGLMGAQQGAMTKRYHSGLASQNGIRSATLARMGMTGMPGSLEAEYGGFLSTLGGGVTPERIAMIREGLGSVWAFEQTGFKPYPVCSSNQSALDVLSALSRELRDLAEPVQSVELDVSTHTFVHSGWSYTKPDAVAAQMNLGYATATMLRHGAVEIEHFAEPHLSDPETLKLIGAIQVRPATDIDAEGMAGRDHVRVRVETASGRVLEGSRPVRRGSHHEPMSDDELQSKFAALAGRVLPNERVQRVSDLVADLETVTDASAITDLLSVPSDR